MSLDLFRLDHKRFIVTGASSGIGFATCLMINKLGGSFIGIARRETELKNLLKEAPHSDNLIIPADLSKTENLKELAASFPPVDGIVHSAGIAERVPLKFYKKEVLDKVREINYDSIVLLLNELVKGKKINREASIVMVASISGLFGSKGNGIYAGSKGALIAISKVWASELAHSKIRVNVVAPGMVRTAINHQSAEMLSAESMAEDEKKYPLGYGDPNDVAAPIAFLLSPASKWITGEVMVIDGGRTMTV